ncbi:class I SAM-dependent methyltransferase [Gimesia aquarii]|uniref:Ubiquinone biosynthesis O-methyltransferase n=1 Tax=Gimesia aquarii TaxID=2527964 RepID=A0A517WRW7_9PLAN|nr:class I SAM-dependent methyltransferase [Gimesia aquarii]QDU07968.1 Ubiquinone biosynthesis O-methyltransferase [Gimesia aquarii]
MTTNYDPIAEQYKRSKQQPWRTFVECFTLMNLVGDPAEMSVLDVACGEGFYTRLIREQGAAHVTGIDLSQGMIDLARSQEVQHQQGIEYVVGDARELPDTNQFDLTVAAWLLNYARNRDELQAMCDGLARSLKQGGRFVTVNCNPAQTFPNAPSYRKYGFETSVLGEWQEGAPIQWRFYLSDGHIDVENYYLSITTHEEALRQAGFREVVWHAPQLAPEGLQENDEEFWSSLMESPPMTFIECVK